MQSVASLGSSSVPSSTFKRSSKSKSHKSRVSRYGSYLVYRKSGMYFRIVVPKNIRQVLNICEIKRSMSMLSCRDANASP